MKQKRHVFGRFVNCVRGSPKLPNYGYESGIALSKTSALRTESTYVGSFTIQKVINLSLTIKADNADHYPMSWYEKPHSRNKRKVY